MLLTVTMNVAIDKRYTVEGFQIGTVMRVKECTDTAGGKGLNVSKVAALLGEDVTASGIIGGHAGEYVAQMLQKHRVTADFVKVEGESRSCINIYDCISHTQTEFLEPGVLVSEADYQHFLEKYRRQLEHCDAVSISGSLPRGLDSECYRELIRAAKEAGKPVLLDTSGALLQDGISAGPTLIKPNTDELQMLCRVDVRSLDEVQAAAESLHRTGIPYVLVSLGKEGALLVCDEGVWKGNTPDIPVVNTVGCGDSMLAAFGVGMIRKLPTPEILKLALAVSTANALRPETGFFVQEDLDALLQQVSVNKIL